MFNLFYLLILSMTTFSLVYADEVYQSKDSNGNIVISNKKSPNATKMDLPNLQVMPDPKVNTPLAKHLNSQTRATVLQEELNHEVALLNQDKQALIFAKNTKPVDQNKINQLNDSIDLHQQNIDLLNQTIRH